MSGKALLGKVKGVRLGKGKGDPTGKTPTAGVLARELGVSPSTARARLAKARGDKPKAQPKQPKPKEGESQRRYTKPDEMTMKYVQDIMKYPPKYVGGSIVVKDREYAELLARAIEEACQEAS